MGRKLGGQWLKLMMSRPSCARLAGQEARVTDLGAERKDGQAERCSALAGRKTIAFYPCRSMWMGSIRFARRAGNHLATRAAPINNGGTAIKTSGSHGFTP